MRNTCRSLCFIVVAIALVACEFSQYSEQYLPVQNTSIKIDGEWVDENGIISSFRNGIFETRAADTNERLSEGSYRYTDDHHVEIEMRSILRGTISLVHCTTSNNKTQLFCTSRSGLQFFLQRNTYK
ncbi:hypothetical protein [Bartonella sp. A05]|uniref:hypothetical protein n=1 Tax=Bartonella sp. A05 TaxID=2967261 RepID=UPI0022A91B5D|nr:hypothetical protein [Bartonella sp. A05]MCZ2203943.1 hypothetical protein [Bartonella sp. A05]